MHLQTWSDLFFTGLFVMLAGVGLLALISPRQFADLATFSSRWIDTDRFFAIFDKRIDIDSRILPHSRLLGVLVLFSVGVLAFLYTRI